MATFAIVITDLEESGVEVNTRSDVELADDTELTPALMLGLAATGFLRETMTIDGDDLTDELAAQIEQPSLELPAGVDTTE